MDDQRNGNSNKMTLANEGTVMRQELSGAMEMRAADAASNALMEQARAMVEARYALAMRKPRDWDNVRTKLLNDCGRSTFAAAAMFRKPKGDGFLEDFSVRFAEAAIRTAGNVMQATRIIRDDKYKRHLTVSATDLEQNASYDRDIEIEKTVERQNSKGRTVLSERLNSRGQTIYIVVATEDELLEKEGAAVSKAFRTLCLRLIPADILDECKDKLRETRQLETKTDPDAARKRLADAFATQGVLPSDLKVYLGHDLGMTTPAEVDELRGVYSGLRDGEFSWPEALDSKRKGDPVSGTAENKNDPQAQTQSTDKPAGNRRGRAAAPAAPAATAGAKPKSESTGNEPTQAAPPQVAAAEAPSPPQTTAQPQTQGVERSRVEQQTMPGSGEPPKSATQAAPREPTRSQDPPKNAGDAWEPSNDLGNDDDDGAES